jgi:spermidine/putrescine transport system permease protein
MSQSRLKRRRALGAPRFALALPAWGWYLWFFIVPLAVIVWYSFGYKPAVGTSGSSIGLDRLSFDNYAVVLQPPFGATFLATLRVAALGTLLCLLVGFPLAYVLATRESTRWKGVLLGLVIVPFWTSFLLRTFAWRILLAPNGALSSVLQDVGLLGGPLQVLDTRGAVQLGVVYNYLPLMIFPIFVALDRLDPALREAAKDLGADRVRTFFQVTVPLAMPGIVSGLYLVFIPLCGEYVTPAVLGGARGLMAGSLVAGQFLDAQNWALGAAMAMTLIGLILAVTAVVALAGVAVGALLRLRRRVDLPVTPAPQAVTW